MNYFLVIICVKYSKYFSRIIPYHLVDFLLSRNLWFCGISWMAGRIEDPDPMEKTGRVRVSKKVGSEFALNIKSHNSSRKKINKSDFHSIIIRLNADLDFFRGLDSDPVFSLGTFSVLSRRLIRIRVKSSRIHNPVAVGILKFPRTLFIKILWRVNYSKEGCSQHLISHSFTLSFTHSLGIHSSILLGPFI